MFSQSYHIFVLDRNISNPVLPFLYDEMTPQNPGQSTAALIHRLMAPPAAPQVSGRVIQTSVWIPRSIH